MSQLSLDLPCDAAANVALGPGALLLRAGALRAGPRLLTDLAQLLARAPLRHMATPGGRRMSVSMSNAGALGWFSDHQGYRYTASDPETAAAWPALPPSFLRLARESANQAGFSRFVPDACLINCYVPGARMSLHQDKNERDFSAPIVSVSLGLPAIFLFGGLERRERARRIPLVHGDVVVWGGPSRLHYHGVLPLENGHHAELGAQRINLTFRKAG